MLWLNADSSLSASKVGMVALLVATLAWSFGSIWSRGRDLPSPFMASAAQMLCGGVAMCIVGALAGERFHGMPTAHGLAAFAYLIAFGSIVGFSAYIWLLHHVRPALAGSYAYVNPAIAVVLGVAGARTLRHARTAGDGRDPARRGRDHPGQGAQARAEARDRRDRGRSRVSDVADRRRGVGRGVRLRAVGLMPLYWHALRAVPSLQILLHRIVWSTLMVGGLLCWRGGLGWLRATLSRPGVGKWLLASGLLIGFNWGLYIWAVNAGHVVETSLGYFINPLLNVVIGVLFPCASACARCNGFRWRSPASACCG